MVWAAVVVQRGGVCMTGVFNRPIQSTHPGAVHEEKLSFSFTGSSFWDVNLRYLNLANGGPGLTAMLRHRSVKLWDWGLFQLAIEPTAGMCRPGCSAGRWPELTWRAAPHTVPVLCIARVRVGTFRG